MANIFHVERAANKITLGIVGTTINVPPLTASLSLGLDASKNLESVDLSGVYQPLDAVLTDLAALDIVADNEFIVGTGAGAYAHESGATVRTSLELGTGDSPTFAGLILSGNLTMPDGGTIGQAAGPLLTFDDTNNYLEITGCSIGIGTAIPESLIHSLAQGNNIITVESYAGTAAIVGKKAQGTIASPTNVTTGNTLLTLGGRGYGNTAFSAYTKATISFRAAEDWTDSEQGTYIDFETTAIGGTTRSIKMRLLNTGGILLKEQASAGADTAAYGQIWCKTATPNELWFTDDAGTDHQIAFV